MCSNYRDPSLRWVWVIPSMMPKTNPTRPEMETAGLEMGTEFELRKMVISKTSTVYWDAAVRLLSIKNERGNVVAHLGCMFDPTFTKHV